MTNSKYTRQQARADKRSIFKELRQLRDDEDLACDAQPAEMDQRDCLAGGAAALAVAPIAAALPVPQSAMSAFHRLPDGTYTLVGGWDFIEDRSVAIAVKQGDE